MSDIELSFITVNYCTPDLVTCLVESIRKFPPPVPWELIVVDNKSPDGSADVIAKRHPDIKFLPLDKNYGFGCGNNRGAALAEGKTIVLINSDAELREESFAKGLDFFKHNPHAGILGLKIYTVDGVLEQTARGFPDASTGIFGRSTFFGKLALKFGKTARGGVVGKNFMSDANATEPYTVDWVSGAAMMIRRECWDKLGGFDEDFFMYWEDADLCYRALKAGYKTYYFTDAGVYHHAGASSKKDPCPPIDWFHNSAYIYVCKHISPRPSFMRGFAWLALKTRAAFLKIRARRKLPLRE